MTKSEVKKGYEIKESENNSTPQFANRYYRTFNKSLNKSLMIHHSIIDASDAHPKYLIEALDFSKTINAKNPTQAGRIIYQTVLKPDNNSWVYVNDFVVDDGYQEIFDLFTKDPGTNYQQRGIGSQLFKLMENHLIENNINSLMLHRLAHKKSLFSFEKFMEGDPTCFADLDAQTAEQKRVDDKVRITYENLGLAESDNNRFQMYKHLTKHDRHNLDDLGLKLVTSKPSPTTPTPLTF